MLVCLLKSLFNDDDPPNPEYQALHTVGQIVYTYFCRPPLVDIGGGSFCSANLRDTFGHLTDGGINLKIIYRAVMDKIVEKGFERKAG